MTMPRPQRTLRVPATAQGARLIPIRAKESQAAVTRLLHRDGSLADGESRRSLGRAHHRMQVQNAMSAVTRAVDGKPRRQSLLNWRFRAAFLRRQGMPV